MKLVNCIIIVCCFIIMATSVAQAQYSVDYQTNTFDGVGSNWAGDYRVGDATKYNVLQIINSGALTNVNGVLGYQVASINNRADINGTGSRWINTAELAVGYSGSDNTLNINNGGSVESATAYIGRGSPAMRNKAIVDGNGSTWSISSTFGAGGSGSDNQLIITNGGSVVNGGIAILGNYGNGSNTALITGSGSLWQSTGDLYIGKNGANKNNHLIINNGGKLMNASCNIGNQPNGNNNIAEISGAGSTWISSLGLTVGLFGAGNSMRISDGAYVVSDSGAIGNQPGAGSNIVTVSDSGSIWSNTVNFYVGSKDSGNGLIITNGGFVYGKYSYLGRNSRDSKAVVSGNNSRWNNFTLDISDTGTNNILIINNGGTVHASYRFQIGAQAVATGNIVRITNDGVLDANKIIVTNPGNMITNSGGVYQFSNVTPTITAVSGGPIVINNGVISFRDLTNAPMFAGTQLSNMTILGNNGYRLNNATNTSVTSYTFDSVANSGDANNYQQLQLVGKSPKWQSTTITIGTGGAMLASNTQATVSGTFNNNGALSVVNSTLTFTQPATINGTVNVDLNQLVIGTNLITTANLTIGAASTISFTGETPDEDVTLFHYTGTRSGTFNTINGLPTGWNIMYGPSSNGNITLHKVLGTVVTVK